MENRFASQVKGIDERMEGRIEAFDLVWQECWSDLKRVLIISVTVFIASFLAQFFGSSDNITPIALEWSLIVGLFTIFVTIWLEFNLSRSIGIMIGSGVARKITKE